jgi:hypothetical protein
MQICRALTHNKWFLPLLMLAMGVILLAAQWAGGNLGSGLAGLAVMAGAGVAVLAGGRSETIRGLRGDGRDERFRTIDVQATAFAGSAVIVALIVAFVVELARGHDGSPYSWLCAVGGVAYIGAIVVQRIRS